MKRKLSSLLMVLAIVAGSFTASIPSFAGSGDPEETSFYRLEATVSGTTQVTDGAGLDLDGSNQIKDELGLRNGNPLNSSAVEAGMGTYETTDTDNLGNTVTPVPAENMLGVADNQSFIKLAYGGKGQGIDAGQFDMGEGITIEGWIYPTGDPANSWAGTRIFNMQPEAGFSPGALWSQLNGTGFTFGVVGDNGSYKQFYSAPDMVKYNEWNYIAITWERGSSTADFYSKSLSGIVLNHDDDIQMTDIGSVPDIFPNANAHASFGYAHLFDMDLGFDGYMDEMRLSNFKRQPSELYIIPDVTKSENFYRFEKTASNITPVTDNALLSLDGASKVKDESGTRNGNAFSGNGLDVGTYESSDVSNGNVTVLPAPVAQMKGVASNNFFSKLDYSKKQGIDLGNLQLKEGLTLEGWIYPTGDKNDTYYSGRFITKRTGWGPGEYWSFLNSDGSLIFGAYGENGYKTWYGSQAKVKFNKWNYVAITWNRDSNDVDFYVKPIDWVMTRETRTDATDIGHFPDSDDNVSIGYSSGTDSGLTGYVDEVRVSNFARSKEQLLINDTVTNSGNATDTYRFEETASGTTPVTAGAYLNLDAGIKDDTGTVTGTAFSGNDSTLGVYGDVSPVPVEEINGVSANNFYAVLDSTIKKQGIDFGATLGFGYGFTFEGWFRPTGDISHADNNGLLIAKRSIAEGGNFWATLNSEGGVTFKMTGDNGATREWKTDANKVQWGNWNYIAIATNRDRVDMDFYIKPINGDMFRQTVRSITNVGLLPDTFDTVTIGYNTNLDAGFDGSVDEVRLTNYKRVYEELLVTQTTNVQTDGNFAVQLDGNPSTNIPTFGSWNRHVVEIEGVYYAAYLDNGEYGHIVKSTDGGATWTDLYATGQMSFTGPPVLVADRSGSLYAIGNGGDGVQLIFMKFSDNGSGMTLTIPPMSLGRLTSKFAAVYSPKDDVIYVSGRVSDLGGHEANVHLFKLDTSGNILTDTQVINSVGDWSSSGDYYDAHYQSIYCDDQGRLHMLYSVYNWPYALSDEWIYTLKHVMYMYSDDGGVSWHKAEGTPISTPFAVNDLTNGGTMISKDGIEGWRAWGSSLLVTGNDVHILYHVYDLGGYDIYQRYVRLSRDTGVEEQRMAIVPHLEDMHSTLVSDPLTGKIYISTQVERRPAVLVSGDTGDTWSVLAYALRPPDNDDYYSNTAYQTVTSDGAIIALTSDWGYLGKRGAVFSKINVRRDFVDTIPPVITVDEPGRLTGNHYNVDKGPLTVTGRLSEPGLVTVNGVSAQTGSDLSFSVTIPLEPGINVVTITATDAAENASGPVTYKVVPNNSNN